MGPAKFQPLSDPQRGSFVTTKQIDVRSYPVVKGLGKPCRKQYLTTNDYLGVILTLFCFALAIWSVQSIRFAAYLGQVNQLIVLGLTLTIMSFTTSKQAQLLLVTLEARFGGSILQNYDAILRNNKFDSQISLLLWLALIALYLLPLGLSASYKRFVGGGSTTTSSSIADIPQIQFGPSGPPGLYLGSGIAGLINATSSLYDGHPQARTQPPQFPSSYGFAMHIINSTHTVMLDSPLSSHLAIIQASLRDGEVQRLSAAVNATYSSLNSTKASPERADFTEYWADISDRFGDAGQFRLVGRW